MMNMLIQLDEERVLADRKYDLADMWRIIDKQFASACHKEYKLEGIAVYTGDSRKDYFTCICMAYAMLQEQDWFAEYCIRWEWNDDDRTEDVLTEERTRNNKFRKI